MFIWGYLALSTIFAVSGQLILKHAMSRIGDLNGKQRVIVLQIVLSPWVIAGFAVYGLGEIFWLLALSRQDVIVIYPFASLSYVGILIGSYFLFQEQISTTRLMGIAVIIVGVAIIGLSSGL